MKKISLFLVLFILVSCKSGQESKSNVELTSKKEVLFNDYAFEITKILSDSRCPEGTNCIWAGELVIEVSVWQEHKLIESSVLTFSPKTREENLAWFSKFLPKDKILQSILISPNKTDKTLLLKDYKLKLVIIP